VGKKAALTSIGVIPGVADYGMMRATRLDAVRR
jgi:hypothetical protein